MHARALARPDRGDRVLPHHAVHAAAADRKVPFADALQRCALRQTIDDSLRNLIAPSPVPSDKTRLAPCPLDAGLHQTVYLGDDGRCAAAVAARTLFAMVMRPAVREVLGGRDGEEASQIRRCAA